ncbi:MAG: hypothetical protein OEV66_11045 [Spirochaetia bacterium]|nr:hypothetical protein [Spirochaetia bacterium]
MAYDDGKFVYSPEVNYSSIDAKNSQEVAPLLDDFKKSYLAPLQTHITTADNFRQYVSSSSVPSDLRSSINVKSEEIERDLMQIVRLFSQIESRLETHNLNSEATHFFHSVFPGEESNDVKLNYLKMIRSYEHLRNFNRNIKEQWMQLRDTFEKYKPSGSSKAFLEQILDFKIYPRIELCEKTDLMLRRMQYILKLPDDYETAKKINYAGNYTSLLNYNIGTLFQLDLDKYIFLDTGSASDEKQEVQVDANTCISDPYFLDSRGSMNFNQSYLYTLSINQSRVESDTEKIRKAVYLETHLSVESQSLRQDMIRHFISNSKKLNNEMEYLRFLNEHFEFSRDGLLFHLQTLNSKEKILFMYHFGPIYFLKLLMRFLREGHTGFIHRFMGQHHMARELPFEYIKFTMKDWWDVHVFKLCASAERNSREYYNSLVEKFSGLWEKEQAGIFQSILKDPILSKAYSLRDFKSMRPFLENELSFMFFSIYSRFLGADFLYMPLNKPPRALVMGNYG